MELNRFKTSFSSNIFRQKYAQGPADTWDALAERVVADVCNDKRRKLMSEADQKQLAQYIKEMKFIPGGRYLYYAGRPAKFFNNCGTADTKLLTDKGWVRFGDVAGKEVNLLSPVDGTFKPAVVHAHGTQDVYEYVLAPLRGRSKIEYRVRFTEDHKWLLKNGTTTEDLKVGDVVPANSFSLDTSDLGFAHGFVFGDGNANGQLRLCADKDLAYLPRLSKVADSVTYPEFANGDPCLYFKQGRFGKWKNLPDTVDPEYIASFIMGWIAADSSGDRVLNSVDRSALEWFREHAAFAGLVITGDLRSQVRDITIGDYTYNNHEIFIQNWCRGDAWAGFKVIDKKFYGHVPVFCPFEPEYNQIVIDHGIRTFNCYLLRAEEDTREEWAEIAWRSMSCLMTGGGIGVNYSILRPSGRVLGRTGGKASGPIPLMHSVNEIGRNVMQGGSRRSAIYASLAREHEDVPLFLKAKNWTDEVRAAKEKDFNAHAPLDMTNISVDYGDEWMSLGDERHQDAVFMENCRQAMSTGEPGFSFNFGDKANETLRNACTEVTSEDDSDVCNLGSINLGNIDTVEEFKSVVALASKFLVCGTLRAKLPYEKVYKVREKNRRLGLGLMGVHEWLLRKGAGYEVTKELHNWLGVYRDESKRAADEHCDQLFIGRPVAYRAIAPTGSLGILAGTTTGIEPLFATAYKRRYLTDGTKWKYEYVVDATTARLVQEYGVDPDSIDTAYRLSHDYERRIKFQADVQDYVDMSISSTINLPSWGSKGNSEGDVAKFASILSKYAPRLRGFTCYPDGSRGGQPLTEVSYDEAMKHRGVVYEENDVCSITGRGGTCGS